MGNVQQAGADAMLDRAIEQSNDALGAIDVSSMSDELQTLDRVSRFPAVYPGWMLGTRGQARVDQLAQTRSARVA